MGAHHDSVFGGSHHDSVFGGSHHDSFHDDWGYSHHNDWHSDFFDPFHHRHLGYYYDPWPYYSGGYYSGAGYYSSATTVASDPCYVFDAALNRYVFSGAAGCVEDPAQNSFVQTPEAADAGSVQRPLLPSTEAPDALPR